MPENIQPINYFIKRSRILLMCYFSRKLFKWNFSEQNVENNIGLKSYFTRKTISHYITFPGIWRVTAVVIYGGI